MITVLLRPLHLWQNSVKVWIYKEQVLPEKEPKKQVLREASIDADSKRVYSPTTPSRMTGKANTGNNIAFGEYGLQALSGWITAQNEAARSPDPFYQGGVRFGLNFSA
jgi:hypothetical protein